MKNPVILSLALISLVFASCSTAEKQKAPAMPGDMRYSEYSGADSLEWPTSSGALADTSFDVLVYRGWPSKPYAVIGEIHHRDPRKEWEEGEIKDAVKGAKMVKADAIIIRLTSESGVGALTGTLGKAAIRGMSGVQFTTTALVIRWQTDSEIQARAARDERLSKQLLAARPELEVNSETGVLILKYLLQSGIRENRADFFEKYQQLMLRVSPRSASDLSGEWVFKAIITHKMLASEREEQLSGIASVKADSENVVILSVEGTNEMNFSGKNLRGQLEGQLGVAGYSAKSDGVAMEDKISLNFRSLTSDGVVQGVVVLQRNRVKANSLSKVKPQNI